MFFKISNNNPMLSINICIWDKHSNSKIKVTASSSTYWLHTSTCLKSTALTQLEPETCVRTNAVRCSRALARTARCTYRPRRTERAATRTRPWSVSRRARAAPTRISDWPRCKRSSCASTIASPPSWARVIPAGPTTRRSTRRARSSSPSCNISSTTSTCPLLLASTMPACSISFRSRLRATIRDMMPV